VGTKRASDIAVFHQLSTNTPKSANPKPPRPAWLPFLEAGGVAIWVFFWASFVVRISNGPSLGPIPLLLAVFLGIIVSDFISGFLHWFFDTFLEVTTPIIGAHLVGPFREHHHDPLLMTRHSLLEQVGNSCIAFHPLFLIVWWLGPVAPQSQGGVFGYWFLLSYGFFLTAANVLHSWAHDPAAPRFARRLQAWDLIVSPEHHQPHHVPPHRTTYCVTTGWANYFTDRFSVFRYLERVFVALGVPLKASDTE
jgi:hypothetical protein